jgi:MFS family permease
MVAVFMGGVAVAANRFKVPPALPALMDELQVDMVAGGWLMSISSVASMVLAIPVAFLLARIGLKITGLIAMSCAVAGSVVGGLADSASVMLLGRVIEGISISLIVVLAPTAVSLWFEPRERGLPMGIWAAWVPVGNVIMFNIAPPLMSVSGWRGIWWSGALLAFVALVIIGLVVKAPTEMEPDNQPKPAPPPSLGHNLSNRSAWLLALTFGAFGFCILGYNTWAPTFLTDVFQIREATASSYASLMFLAAIPANLIAGWLINRLKNRYHLLPATFLVTSLFFFWSFRLPSRDLVIPYMFTLGFVSNFIPTATFTLAPETMPSVQYAGLAIAIVMTGSNLGSLIGPPILGAILSHGTWAAGSTSLVIVMLVGTLVAWHVSKKLQAS